MSPLVLPAVLGLVLGSARWASLDSRRYDWRAWRHPRRSSCLPVACSERTWFLAVVVLWPVFFPGYLMDRRHAPRQGERRPRSRDAEDRPSDGSPFYPARVLGDPPESDRA